MRNIHLLPTLLLHVLLVTPIPSVFAEPIETDARDKICREGGDNAKTCVYINGKNEDGLHCVIGTDDDDNRTYYGQEYCLHHG